MNRLQRQVHEGRVNSLSASIGSNHRNNLCLRFDLVDTLSLTRPEVEQDITKQQQPKSLAGPDLAFLLPSSWGDWREVAEREESVVGNEGLEPTFREELEPKSSASTNFASRPLIEA